MTSPTGDGPEEFAHERDELINKLQEGELRFLIFGDHEYGYNAATGQAWERHADGRTLMSDDPMIPVPEPHPVLANMRKFFRGGTTDG